jgi:hypothetical protein
MRIVPPIRPIRDGKILDVNLINQIINRTEYGAELLARYKMVAGSNIFVEQAGNGLGVSYLTALAGGAGTGSGGAGTGSGGAGTGTGGAGTGSGGSGTGETGQGGTVGDTIFISVIDESSNSPEFLEQKGREFISRYGNITIFVFIPSTVPDPFGSVRIEAYPYAQPYLVNRDGGVVANATDWFTLVQAYINTSRKIQLSIDNSGSMTTATVLASYNLFKARLQSAGFPSSGIVEPAMPNEDWISCHIL